MTDAWDSPDAPPLDDADFPVSRPGVPSPDATALTIALNRVAASLDRVAERLSVSPGGAQPPATAQPPGSPTGPPVAPPGGQSNVNETQVKRGKKIYAICAAQSGGKPSGEWDIGAIGLRVTGHAVNPNSQKWAEVDQVAVLDAFTQWGIG